MNLARVCSAKEHFVNFAPSPPRRAGLVVRYGDMQAQPIASALGPDGLPLQVLVVDDEPMVRARLWCPI